MKDAVTACSFIAEFMKLYEFLVECTEENGNNDSITAGANSFVRIIRNCIAGGAQPLARLVLNDGIPKAKKFMKKAENEKEKKEWETIIKKLESYEQFYSKETSFDWKLNALEAIKFYESGTLGKMMEMVTDHRVINEASDITKDVRRTMKLPKEYEKYVNVAGSILQFFLGNEEKKEEELEFD